MKVPWWPIVGLIVGLAGVVAFDRWSTREDRWKERLAETAARVRSEDSIAYHALRGRFVRDSVRVDSLLAVADSAEQDRIRLGQDNGRLRVRLSRALAANDTSAIITEQAAVIANQDSIIRSDSGQKATLRTTINSQRETIVDLNTSLADARRRLADLIGVAERPPKEFKLFGWLKLQLKPSIGYGAQVETTGERAGRISHGVQLHVSILRG